MSSRLRALWPLLLGLVAFVAMLGVVLARWYQLTGGNFSYPLDDPYIHMALAKNVVAHGLFGVTPFEFTSASSSPIWTFMLAAVFAVTGSWMYVPLVIAIAAAIGLLVTAEVGLTRFGVTPGWRAAAMLWLVFVTPMAPIVFGAMEHPLQILVDVALVFCASALLAEDRPSSVRLSAAVLVLGVLAGAIRYEGIVLCAVIALLFALRRRWLFAAGFFGASLLPAVLYGIYSKAHGGFFLPNPALIKGASSAGIGLLFTDAPRYVSEFMATKWPTVGMAFALAAVAVVLGVVQIAGGRRFWDRTVVFAAIVVAVSLVQLTLGDVGWLFRYEAYVKALIGLAVIIQASDVIRLGIPSSKALRFALALAVVVAGWATFAGSQRGWLALRTTPTAMENVYDQQVQMARFVKANPQYTSIAIGDLGAISFFNDGVRILDLEGLGENGVPLEKLGRSRIKADDIRARVAENGSQIAIVFPDYWDVPSEWVRVGEWRIPRNLANFTDRVEFYAIPPTDPAQLRADIERFSRELPAEDGWATFGAQ